MGETLALGMIRREKGTSGSTQPNHTPPQRPTEDEPKRRRAETSPLFFTRRKGKAQILICRSSQNLGIDSQRVRVQAIATESGSGLPRGRWSARVCA